MDDSNFETTAKNNLEGQETALAIHTETEKEKNALQLYAYLAVGIIVATVSIGLYLSSNSLPGEALYPIKTSFIERTISGSKLTTHSKVQYESKLLETRLFELQTLVTDSATTTPETLATVASLIEDHVNNVSFSLQNASASDLTARERVNALSRIMFLTKASETLAETSEELSPITQSLEEIRRNTNASLELAVVEYASSTSPEEAAEYIIAEIEQIAAKLDAIAPGSDAARLTTARVNDANEAIADGNIADAILFILRAEEAIAVDEYLFASERGDVKGVPTETQPIPEGN